VLLWPLGVVFGLVGISWLIIEYASAYRFEVNYRSLYIRERLNYLVPLYLVGLGGVVLTIIDLSSSWFRAYVSYVTILGLTVGGRTFFNRIRKRVIRSLDVYDLDLDLPVVSTAVALVPISIVNLVFMTNIISGMALFLDSLIMYIRASRKYFDIGWSNALLYSLPLLVVSMYALILSIVSIVVFVLALSVLILFISDLLFLGVRRNSK